MRWSPGCPLIVPALKNKAATHTDERRRCILQQSGGEIMAVNPFLQFEDQQLAEHNRRLWTLLGANAAISAALLIAVLILILRPRALPYVVEVNQHGEPIAVAQPVLGTQLLNDVVIKWATSEFIRNAKTVTAISMSKRTCYATPTLLPRSRRPRRLPTTITTASTIHLA